jgi:hypothetical protein
MLLRDRGWRAGRGNGFPTWYWRPSGTRETGGDAVPAPIEVRSTKDELGRKKYERQPTFSIELELVLVLELDFDLAK